MPVFFRIRGSRRQAQRAACWFWPQAAVCDWKSINKVDSLNASYLSLTIFLPFFEYHSFWTSTTTVLSNDSSLCSSLLTPYHIACYWCYVLGLLHPASVLRESLTTPSQALLQNPHLTMMFPHSLSPARWSDTALFDFAKWQCCQLCLFFRFSQMWDQGAVPSPAFVDHLLEDGDACKVTKQGP